MNTAGFFGKLPMVGDFVHRDLSYECISAWDEWFQHFIQSCHAQFGNAWARNFHESPLWYFIIAHYPQREHTTIGAMAPSRDRVGRHFPIAISLSLKGTVDLCEFANANKPWFELASDVLGRRYEKQLELENFARQISALPDPCVRPIDTSFDQNRRPLITDWCYLPDAPVDWERCFKTLQARLTATQTAAGSLWWSTVTSTKPPCLLVCRHLPEPDLFTAALSGDWRERGWDVKRIADGR